MLEQRMAEFTGLEHSNPDELPSTGTNNRVSVNVTPLGPGWDVVRSVLANSPEVNAAFKELGSARNKDTSNPGLQHNLSTEQKKLYEVMRAIIKANGGNVPGNITNMAAAKAMADLEDLLSDAHENALLDALETVKERFPDGDRPAFGDIYGQGGLN